jgi:hypothetical protein
MKRYHETNCKHMRQLLYLMHCCSCSFHFAIFPSFFIEGFPLVFSALSLFIPISSPALFLFLFPGHSLFCPAASSCLLFLYFPHFFSFIPLFCSSVVERPALSPPAPALPPSSVCVFHHATVHLSIRPAVRHDEEESPRLPLMSPALPETQTIRPSSAHTAPSAFPSGSDIDFPK